MHIAYKCGLEAAYCLILLLICYQRRKLVYGFHIFTPQTRVTREYCQRNYIYLLPGDMSLRTMEQTWVSSFISSRIVHVANGNQTEIANVSAVNYFTVSKPLYLIFVLPENIVRETIFCLLPGRYIASYDGTNVGVIFHFFSYCSRSKRQPNWNRWRHSVVID